ncbi:MAG: ABC transporter ATP-binding protein [Nocardioides sp.]|nr:ABC transporter ATP-binding protein [Nocardioides sp.]
MNTTTDSNQPAIEARGLRRSYGTGAAGFEAVRGVDLIVPRGTITALLGTNGAGKTSTMEVIEGLAPATAGEVRMLGMDPIKQRADVRRRTGVLLQASGFPGDLTVRETLEMWGATVSAARPVDEALEVLDLTHRAEVKMRSLSGGETRRVDLACTLTGDPDVVLLDEPTTGLDPESRREVWRLVEGLRERGATVLITTHYLDEAEALADRVEIMHGGRIVRSGTTAEIVSDHPSSIRFAHLAADSVLPDLSATSISRTGAHTVVETDDLQATLHELLGWAHQHCVRLDDLSADTASLEKVFLAIADGSADATTHDSTHQSTQLEGNNR